MDNIIDIELTGRSTRRDQKLWQYDYGQVLRIAGKEFPKVTEVQFSLQQSGGHTLDRIGTSNNGLLTVQIPNELLQNKGTTSDYTIYAFVYLSGDGYGNTKYMIQLPVESRPEPTDPSEDPTIDPSIFKDAINSVNASAERAEEAEKTAKESAENAKGYADDARKSKEVVENARDDAVANIGKAKESALSDIASKTNESVQKIQIQAEASQNGINQSIENATEKKSELDGAISNATDAKGNLDKAVQSAGNAKTELDTSIEKAGEVKTALDSAINSAGEQKSALDTTIEQANTIDTSLKEQIGSAEQIQANVEQIAKNKADISSLNEDLEEVKDKKITKFYASNQGETHITDSDKGLIQDLKIYGQSKQDGEPSPSNPVEIKNVVNPKMSVCGSNILQKDKKYINPTKFDGNVTLNDDESISYEGSISNVYASIYIQRLTLKKGTYQLLANQYSSSNDIGAKLIIEKASGNLYVLNNTPFTINADDTKCRLFISSEGGTSYPLPVSGTVRCALVYSGSTTDIQPYIGKSVTLPITLNAIPVSSGGNVTINGQQYIADRVVEKDGVFGIERNIREIHTNTKTMNNSEEYPGWKNVEGISDVTYYNVDPVGDSRKLTFISNFTRATFLQNNKGTNNILYYIRHIIGYSQSELIAKAIDVDMYIRLQDAIFEPLPGDIQAKLRTLVTNYPVTNISVTSDQLDGYTVFNYPISMANGWNYVKQQLNDNRDYIYDMDIQSAEAYVNSEYAVVLTELEV